LIVPLLQQRLAALSIEASLVAGKTPGDRISFNSAWGSKLIAEAST
jgi:hypothetical protein